MKHLVIKGLFSGLFSIMIIIVSSSFVSASWSLTQVYYDAPGSDKGFEWVEITGSPIGNDAMFFDNNGNHRLRLVKNSSCSDNCVIIIADNADVFQESFINNDADLDKSCVDNDYFLFDSSFSLSNSGETIGLIVNNSVVLQVFYSAIAHPGLSVFFNGSSWYEGKPSPCFIAENSDDYPAVPELPVSFFLFFLFFSLIMLFVRHSY